MKQGMIFAAVLGVLFCSNCYASSPPNRLSQGIVVQEQPLFEGWNKLDLRSKNLYKSSPDSKEWADVIIKVTRRPTQKDLKKLHKAGFKESMTANIILTGKIQMANLPHLAALETVVYVEAAAPLGQK